MRTPILIWVGISLAAGLSARQATAEPPRPVPVQNHSPPQPKPGRYTEHFDQGVLSDLVGRGQMEDAVEMAFEKGDGFFDNLFLADSVFGAGANVGHGQRFTRVPRADLRGPGEWANHVPARATGPNAASCLECHTVPEHDGSGLASANAIRDPLHSGNPALFISRNTPHLFGMGAVQLLAEEMTDDLQAILAQAKHEACGDGAPSRGSPVRKNLLSKGIDYGWITVQESAAGSRSRCNVRAGEIRGLDSDLVVKPFQWKGVVPTIRAFNRDAAYNEVGLESVELVGEGVDGDGDGVTDEVSVGDLTALTVYVAGQPRPTTKQEMAYWEIIPQLSPGENQAISRGARTFERVGCAVCHVPEMKLKNSVFSEPSQSPYFRELLLPDGEKAVAKGIDPAKAIRFDLTHDVIGDFKIGLFQKDEAGMTRVQLFGDLQRHDLGAEDSESIDETGDGMSTWMTRNLWGMGSTAPYMHDGRATTMGQAIDSHGGEGAASRAMYYGLSTQEKDDLEKFLLNLRLFKPVDDDS